MRFVIAIICLAVGVLAGPALADIPITVRVLIGIVGVSIALVGGWRYRHRRQDSS